jgi:tetratricopeptide (TPR) repeat protein
MAVDASIPPHRKTQLHARMLAVLEQRGDADPAVLAHHAEGAANEEAVLRHAREAARRSSLLGAHREAAAQYSRALRFANSPDPATLASLHEGIATEFSLLDRWEEAEDALRIAVRLRQQLGDTLRVGEDLCRLSTTLWRLCRGTESVEAAAEAVAELRALPPGRELGWAYAARAATHLRIGQFDKGLDGMEQAAALGSQLGDPELASYALNGAGLGRIAAGHDGIASIEQALNAALDAGCRKRPRAYSSLQHASATLHRYADSERYFSQGMAYCDERAGSCRYGRRERRLDGSRASLTSPPRRPELGMQRPSGGFTPGCSGRRPSGCSGPAHNRNRRRRYCPSHAAWNSQEICTVRRPPGSGSAGRMMPRWRCWARRMKRGSGAHSPPSPNSAPLQPPLPAGDG